MRRNRCQNSEFCKAHLRGRAPRPVGGPSLQSTTQKGRGSEAPGWAGPLWVAVLHSPETEAVLEFINAPSDFRTPQARMTSRGHIAWVCEVRERGAPASGRAQDLKCPRHSVLEHPRPLPSVGHTFSVRDTLRHGIP